MKNQTNNYLAIQKLVPYNVDSQYKGNEEPPDELQTPKQQFDNFLKESLYKHIAEQTNLYSVQVTGSSIKTDENKIHTIYWHTYIDGNFEIPQYRVHWSQFTRCSSISEIMSVKQRFETIEQFFYESDNDKMPKKRRARF